MPTRLRPTNPTAADAILVGDPGRALLLAQELLEEPKMSNHARGLWGYSGPARDGGGELTVQSTGIGGPSAAAVLADLAKLGLRRAIRIGTCRALPGGPEAGATVTVAMALGADGASRALAAGAPPTVGPPEAPVACHADPGLLAELRDRDRPATSLSRDLDPSTLALAGLAEAGPGGGAGGSASVADLQTATLFALAARLSIAAAALLVVEWDAAGGRLDPTALDDAVKSAGRRAAAALARPRP